jgi:hypothetical protein
MRNLASRENQTMRRSIIVIGILASLAAAGLVFAGPWLRDRRCEWLLTQVLPRSDVKVRRSQTDRCYLCRDDGPLYDIAYTTCSPIDPIYEADNGTHRTTD